MPRLVGLGTGFNIWFIISDKGRSGSKLVYCLSFHLMQKSKEELKTKKAISEHITLKCFKKRMGWAWL